MKNKSLVIQTIISIPLFFFLCVVANYCSPQNMSLTRCLAVIVLYYIIVRWWFKEQKDLIMSEKDNEYRFYVNFYNIWVKEHPNEVNETISKYESNK